MLCHWPYVTEPEFAAVENNVPPSPSLANSIASLVVIANKADRCGCQALITVGDGDCGNVGAESNEADTTFVSALYEKPFRSM